VSNENSDFLEAEKRAVKIERKKILLGWLKGRPAPDDTGSIENYMCLRGILEKAGWTFQGKLWSHQELGQSLPIIPAVIAETERQIRDETRIHLEKIGIRPHE
jgi:hypothetical protein